MLAASGADVEALDDLRWLLAQKNPAQYVEDWPASRSLADDAVIRARRLVAKAEAAFIHAEHTGWPTPAPPQHPLAAAVKAAAARPPTVSPTPPRSRRPS